MTGMDLAEFLLARVAEDEAVARAAAKSNGDTWRMTLLLDGYAIAGAANGGNPRGLPGDDGLWDHEGALGMWPETASHVARWDPARVLAECEAKRRVVELHGRTDGMGHKPDDGSSYGEMSSVCTSCGTPDEYGTRWPCRTLRPLALPYADHREFREEWRP